MEFKTNKLWEAKADLNIFACRWAIMLEIPIDHTCVGLPQVIRPMPCLRPTPPAWLSCAPPPPSRGCPRLLARPCPSAAPCLGPTPKLWLGPYIYHILVE